MMLDDFLTEMQCEEYWEHYAFSDYPLDEVVDLLGDEFVTLEE